MFAFLLKTFPHFCHWREGGERPQQNSCFDVEGPPSTAPSQPPSTGPKTHLFTNSRGQPDPAAAICSSFEEVGEEGLTATLLLCLGGFFPNNPGG